MGANGPPLLKTFAAIDGTSLGGPKRDRGFFSALRADCLRFYSLNATRTRFCALGPICFAGLAPFGLILEAFVREKHLLAGSENKLGSTIGALQDLVMVFHTLLRGPGSHKTGSGVIRGQRTDERTYKRATDQPAATKLLGNTDCSSYLVLLTPLLLPETLTRESLFGPPLFPRLHVVAVLLDFLDDVLRLHLPLEAPECVFQRLALLNNNFCHAYSPPSLCLDWIVGFELLYRYPCEPAMDQSLYRRLSSKSRLKLHIKVRHRIDRNSLVSPLRSSGNHGSPGKVLNAQRPSCDLAGMLLE